MCLTAEKYWPVVTAAPNATFAAPDSTDGVTQVVGNITMTSPSVYMIFDHLQAISSTVLDITCSTSTPLGAESRFTQAGGGAAAKLIGGPYTNAVVSLDPTSLTSLVRDLGPINTASVVSEIAHGGPSYSYWVNAVQGTARNYDNFDGRGFSTSVLAQPVDFHNLAVPKAEAYYMNINGAPGCNRMGAHPQCSTIFDGDYRAQLLVPEQVRSLRADWANCYDPLFGALDPPIALTPAASIKGPTKPAETTAVETSKPDTTTAADTVKEPEQTTAAPGPTVPSNASPTANLSENTPTAIPATTPNDESDDESASDDNPASGDEPASDDKPASDDTPASEDKPASNDQPASDDKPVSDNDPVPDDQPANNNDPSSNDKPSSDDQNSSNDDSSSDNQAPSDDKPSSGDTSSSSHSDSSEPGDPGSDGDSAQNADTAKPTPGAATGSQDSGTQDGSSNTGGSGSSNGNGASDNNSEGEANGSESQDKDGNEQSGSDSGGTSPTQVVDIGGSKHTVVAQNGLPVVDGTTLAANGAPTTIGGQVVSAASGAVVIGSEALQLASDPTAGSGSDPKIVFTADDQTLTAVPRTSQGILVVDGTTISAGQAAVTVHGATISAATDGLVVDDATKPYSDATGSGIPAVLTLSSSVATASSISSNVFAIGTVTLTAGERGTTILGHVISAAPTGIVVDGTSESASTRSTEQTRGTQVTESSTSSTQPDDASATGSGASKLDGVQWAVLVSCGLILVF